MFPRGILLAPLAAVLLSSTASAMVKTGESVTIGEREIIDENLYVTGGDVTFRGVCYGDLIVSGGTVRIDGEVHGDVMAAGGQVYLGGVFDGDVRAMGGEVKVTGPVDGDLMAMGGDVTVTGDVAGHAFLAGGMVAALGPVAGDLYLAGGQMTLGDEVGGDVTARGSALTLGENALVRGNVDYEGDASITARSGAVVQGSIVDRRVETHHVRSAFFGWLRGLVGFFVLGVVWVAFFRRFVGIAGATLRNKPGASFAIGLATLVGAPIAAFLLFVAGAMVGGWWIGVFGFAIYGIASALAVPLVALLVGGMAAKYFAVSALERTWVALLAALAVMLAVMAVPFLGPLVGFIVVAFGLGATVLSLSTTLEHTRREYHETSEA